MAPFQVIQAKKWRLAFFRSPAILKRIFELKNSEYAIRKQKKIGKNGKNLSHISGISLGKFVANKRKSQIEIRFANGILC